MVSLSPRLRDDLEYDEPETIDPRMSFGFQSMTFESGDEEFEHPDDFHRPQSRGADPSLRKKKRHRQNKALFGEIAQTPFSYETVADGDLFRLIEVAPGIGSERVSCRMLYETIKAPKTDYRCLSYCWGEDLARDEEILCNDRILAVTSNLLSAMRSLRRRNRSIFLWVDQICINQEDLDERAKQVSIMKHIFNQAKDVCVWLGEEDENERMHKLFEYADRLRRSDDSVRTRELDRILTPRQLLIAIRKLLDRPWFQRVWVIPEVALAKSTFVACGESRISWDNLVRLIRKTKTTNDAVFDKQSDLLGNPRQRIAIITEMIGMHRRGLAHTDITQLLIIAKSSQATDLRDMIYAFYSITLLTTFPDYTRSIELLYAEIIHMYVNSIKWEMSYSKWHDLSEAQRTFQLMSILYSAGALHQHRTLPSWIPDLTFSWHLSPIWCKTTSTTLTASNRDDWSTSIRSEFRAGGWCRETFEIIDRPHGMHQLRLSVIMLDTIITVSETSAASTPDVSEHSLMPHESDSSTLRYGRSFFCTTKGDTGIATPGVQADDKIAIVLGGDVPVVLRPCHADGHTLQTFRLLCECLVQNDAVMNGVMAESRLTLSEDVVLI